MNPLFSGFGEIKASDSLKRRLYAVTAEHGSCGARKSKLMPISVLASIAVCAVLAVVFVYRTPDKVITPVSSEAVSGAPAAMLTEEKFTLLAFSEGRDSPLYLSLDGVKVILPNMGPDYRTEMIDGKMVEALSGWTSPDLSVSGEGVKAVTYTAENELFMYEDPRAWTTAEGLPTWLNYTYVAPDYDSFADPYHPTTEEVTRSLEELRERGELLAFEEMLFRVRWAEEYLAAHGRPPADEDYRAFFDLEDAHVSVPLDYTQFVIETDVDEDYRNVLITLLNPENLIDTPIQYANSVTTRPGEIVAYYYSDETSAKMEVKGEYDLTQIRDTIKVDVLFDSGNVKTAYLHVEHDADGVLSMRASEGL
jgi:hypothetical protein